MGRGEGKGTEANGRLKRGWRSAAKYEAVGEASPVFDVACGDAEDGCCDGTIYTDAERRAFSHRPVVNHACLWSRRCAAGAMDL
jgi:hypothetical protein